MDAILEFKKAAKGLQQDERYLELEKTRKANDSDDALQKMLGDFNLTRLNLNKELENDERDDDKISEMNRDVNELYNSIMTNENMLAYTKAKESIELFMEYVNAIINTAIDGGDPMEVEEPTQSCGEGGCSSCEGCG